MAKRLLQKNGQTSPLADILTDSVPWLLFIPKICSFLGIFKLSFHIPLSLAVQFQCFHDGILHFLRGRPRREEF